MARTKQTARKLPRGSAPESRPGPPQNRSIASCTLCNLAVDKDCKCASEHDAKCVRTDASPQSDFYTSGAGQQRRLGEYAATSTYRPVSTHPVQGMRHLPEITPEPRPPPPRVYHPVQHQASQQMRVLPNITPEPRPSPRTYWADPRIAHLRSQIAYQQAQMAHQQVPSSSSNTVNRHPNVPRSSYIPSRYDASQSERVLSSTTPEPRPTPRTFAAQTSRVLPNTIPEPRPTLASVQPPSAGDSMQTTPIWEYYGMGPPPSDPVAYAQWSQLFSARCQQTTREVMEKIRMEKQGALRQSYGSSASSIGAGSSGDSAS